MSIATLIEKIKRTGNPTVFGLDPRPEYVPDGIRQKNYALYGNTLKAEAQSFLDFNCALIDGLCDIIPAVKPQSAYYEMLGPEGAVVLRDTIFYAKSKGLYVIADVKRNDIGSTAEAYAEAYLGAVTVNGQEYEPYGADSMTVNPYLGTDGIEPFLKKCRERSKSIFVLVKTSNPSSGEFQNKLSGDKTFYELVAEKLNEWGETAPGGGGTYSSVGAVIGATYPEEQKKLRALLQNTYFLVPGYGAQGAGASDIINAFHKDGLGAIVNSSRAIMCAWKKTGKNGEDYIDAARAEALSMREQITNAIATL